MFTTARPGRSLSRRAFLALAGCVAGAVALSVADGLMRADLQPSSLMWQTWIVDFRGLFEQGIYAATVFWAAASFVETRTLLTVGFDRLDAGALVVRGPDDANIVWIGRRYGARMEAEVAAAALESRLRASAPE